MNGFRPPDSGRAPSGSAYNVAICRAVAAHDPLEAMRGPDAMAELFLSEDARRSLYDERILVGIRRKLAETSPGGYEYFLARTAWFDEAFTEALKSGVEQVVILGAGYDTRAWRFADHVGDRRVFEFDAPATQRRKLEMLAAAEISQPTHLSLASLDLAREDLTDALAGAGLLFSRRTLVLCQGVTYYLSPEAVSRTLELVSGRLPTGSEFCFDYMLPEAEIGDRFGAAISRAFMAAAYAEEPLRFDLPPGRVADFVAGRGLRLVEHLQAPDLERRYLTLPDGRPVGRVLDLFGFVRAAVP